MAQGYEIDDPRPIAYSAPYTYFLPPAARLAAVASGDWVKAIFRSVPQSEKWDAERLWIRVLAIDADWIEGTIDSQPDDIPALQQGAPIRVPRSHVINIIFETAERETNCPSDDSRSYWERCLVDQAVLAGELAVGYIYREEPEPMREGEKYPDSGWRIRGDARSVSDEEVDQRKAAYIALGKVLNKDDPWLHLIDEPPGSAFIKDFELNVFIKVD
jgi:hypothetical protein